MPISVYEKDFNDSGCQELVSTAIAEVSKDFLSGQKAPNFAVESDDSRLSSDTEFKLMVPRGLSKFYAGYPENGAGLSDTDWNPYGTESDSNASPTDHRLLTDSRSISFNPEIHSTGLNCVTPMSPVRHRYSLNDEGTSRETGTTVVTLRPEEDTQDFSSISHVTDTTGSPAKLERDVAKFVELQPELNRTMRDAELATKGQYSSIGDRSRMNGDSRSHANKHGTPTSRHDTRNRSAARKDDGVTTDEDALSRKVEKVLSQTEHLEASVNRRILGRPSNVDYNLLHKDLQDITNSLQQFEPLGTGDSTMKLRHSSSGRKTPVTSDNDGDIIPSTTTTPEKSKNKMAWDFAADLGYVNPGGLMGEISLDTYSSNSQRPSTSPKQTYNSDGDETRTSGSSQDHAAADQALADMNDILYPSNRHHLQSNRDVDSVLNNFRNQRHQLESRYEQLNNPSLSEKVFRILTNQDPTSQAQGILSNISAEEKDSRARNLLGLKKSEDSFTCDQNDSVRRRLDMSGLSVDSVQESMPNGFLALDDMSKFLDKQMQKFNEKNFNHSIESIIRPAPQSIQCYPVHRDQGKEGHAKEEEKEADARGRSHSDELAR